MQFNKIFVKHGSLVSSSQTWPIVLGLFYHTAGAFSSNRLISVGVGGSGHGLIFDLVDLACGFVTFMVGNQLIFCLDELSCQLMLLC